MGEGLAQLAPPGNESPDLLVIAGEHSGDQHAAVAVEGLLRSRPGMRIAAMGGPALRAAGAELIFDMTGSSVVGLVEVIRNLPYWKDLYRKTVGWIEKYKPKAVCFVDYPGFNLRLAAELKEKGLSRKGGGGVRTLYYISPQIWAWKGKRRFLMADTLDALAVIFPFEVEIYSDTSLPVEFVGHPFLSPTHEQSLQYDPEAPMLLLPGSREVPVKRIFPALIDAFSRLRESVPGLEAAVLYPDDRIRAVIEAMLDERSGVRPHVELRSKDEGGVGRVVLTSSGTMSLNCALAAIPGAVAYKANWLTYLVGRSILTVPYLGICNILLGKEMYPEFIQGQATPERLAAEALACVSSGKRIEQTRADAAVLRDLLAAPGKQSVDKWLEKQLE